MSNVLVPVSIIGLRGRLLLPENAQIASAAVHRFAAAPGDGDVLMLTVDLPDAPEDAATAEAVYTHSGHRDPVELQCWRFRRADGSEITPGGGTPAAS